MKREYVAFLFIFLLIFSLFTFATFSSAQTAPNPVLVDTTFVPYTSADCGNVNTDCLLAVTTSMLISLNQPGVVGNETGFIIHLKDVLSTFPAPANYTGGYFIHEVMNATTRILQ
jgi:hypothetical protein